MSNNRFNCCQKLQCAYLILEAKVLGTAPVFGTPTVKIWGSKFRGYTGPMVQGYTGPDAITGCGPILETKVPKYAGISAGLELWSTPKLLVELPGDNIIWGGKENLKYGDYSYFVKGKFILPTEYAGATLQNSEIIDDQTYYKLYVGTNSEDLEILRSIKGCFGISRDEVPSHGLPKITKPNGDIGELCDMIEEGVTAGFVDIFADTPIKGGENEIDEQFVFDIKVEYSSEFDSYLSDVNSNVFFSVSNIQEVQSGFFKAYCDVNPGGIADRALYCGGGTIKKNDRCYNVNPGTQGYTKFAYGYFQSKPRILKIFKVDLYRCKDQNDVPYVSIGNIDFVKDITVMPYVPTKTNPKDLCEKDFCYDLISQETQNNKQYKGTINRGIRHTGCYYYKDSYVCSGVNNINRDVSWSSSDSCSSLSTSTYCGDDPGPYDQCLGDPSTGRPPVDCSGKNAKIKFVWKLFDRQSQWNECCGPDGTPYNPPRCGCEKTSSETNAPDLYASYVRIVPQGQNEPPDPDCGKVTVTRTPNNCGGENVFTEKVVCGQHEFSYPDPCRCNISSGEGEPEYILYRLPITYTYNFKRTPGCPPPDNENDERNEVIPQAYGEVIYNPARYCWGQYDWPIEFRYGQGFCCCPADGPPDGGDGSGNQNNSFIVTVNHTENTTYVINPYIMIDSDPRYFDGPNNTVPNFYKYMEHYLTIWKQDRLNLDETVNDYKVYVDNPKCNTGFSAPKHPNFYIFNENKGITSGNLTNTIECRDGTEGESFYPRYTNIPNPNYPCKNIFSFDRTSLCSPPISIPSFNDISRIYSNTAPKKRPECFNNLIDYFNAELLKDSEGNTLYYVLDGITLNKCIDIHSIDFLNDILKY